MANPNVISFDDYEGMEERAETAERERVALRADLARLCGLLRNVQHVNTVGEINKLVRACQEVEERWKIGEAQP